MAAKSQPEASTTKLQESLSQTRATTLDTVAAIAEANQRVVGKLIDLSSSAALETVRTYAELQAAFIDAVRTAPAPGLPSREGLEEFGRNALGWYDKQFVGAANATERLAKLVETNAQIVARGFERFGAETEKASKDIREAVTSCIDRVKDIQGWNGSKPVSSAN